MASPPQAISDYFTLLKNITTEAEIQEKFKQTTERIK